MHLRNAQIWPWGHIQFISICKTKFKPEFKCFAGWGQCLRSHSLLGLEALRPPCPAGHPSLAPLLTPPAGHARGSLPHPTIQDQPPEAGRNQNPPSHWACTNLSQLAGLKERSWTLRAPKKKFILINFLNNFKTCLHEAIFICTQTHVYKQLSSDYHHTNEGIFKISSPKYLFLSGSQTSAVTNKEHEMGGQKLWSGKGKEHITGRSTQQSKGFVLSEKNLFPCRQFNPYDFFLFEGRQIWSEFHLQMVFWARLSAWPLVWCWLLKELKAASAALGNFP